MAPKSLAQALALRRAELDRAETLRYSAVGWFLQAFELVVPPEDITICQREDGIEVHLTYNEAGLKANVFAALQFAHATKFTQTEEREVYWPEHFYRWQLKRQPAAIYETVVDAILADLNLEAAWSQERKNPA